MAQTHRNADLPETPSRALFGFDAAGLTDAPPELMLAQPIGGRALRKALTKAIFAKDVDDVRRLIAGGAPPDQFGFGLLLAGMANFQADIMNQLARALPRKAWVDDLADLPGEAVRNADAGACEWLAAFSERLTDLNDILSHLSGVRECLEAMCDEQSPPPPPGFLDMAGRALRAGVGTGVGWTGVNRFALFNLTTLLLDGHEDLAADLLAMDGGFSEYVTHLCTGRLETLTAVRMGGLARFIDSKRGCAMGADTLLRKALEQQVPDHHPAARLQCCDFFKTVTPDLHRDLVRVHKLRREWPLLAEMFLSGNAAAAILQDPAAAARIGDLAFGDRLFLVMALDKMTDGDAVRFLASNSHRLQAWRGAGGNGIGHLLVGLDKLDRSILMTLLDADLRVFSDQNAAGAAALDLMEEAVRVFVEKQILERAARENGGDRRSADRSL